MPKIVKHAFLVILLFMSLGTAWADSSTSGGVGVSTDSSAGTGTSSGSSDSTALPPGVVPTPTTQTFGVTPDSKNQYNQMMEQCKVVDQDGNGLIKAYMADSGVNLTGDASAWIWVPYGQCAKLNAGDFSGISPKILSKIDTSNIQQAPTLGQ